MQKYIQMVGTQPDKGLYIVKNWTSRIGAQPDKGLYIVKNWTSRILCLQHDGKLNIHVRFYYLFCLITHV